MDRRFARVSAACVFACVAGLASIAQAIPLPTAAMLEADETAAAYKSVVDSVGPTLVTVKFIMKIEAGGQMSEMFGRMAEEGVETEVTGVMIEKSGLVLVSNTQLGGYMGMMASRMGGGVTPNPTDLKVLVGDDTEGLKAKFLARDKDVDLAWIQIDDPKAAGKTFASVDLAKANASPTVGTKLLTINRLGKYFDHAVVVSEGRLGGMAKKPRSLLIPSGLQESINSLGMPVFDGTGALLGFSVLQMPSREDMEGGDSADMAGGAGIMVLPAGEVAKATARSKELGSSEASKSAEKPADKPADKPVEKPAETEKK